MAVAAFARSFNYEVLCVEQSKWYARSPWELHGERILNLAAEILF